MTGRRAAFARWRAERAFWGALLIALGGIEEFFSGQLDIGRIHIQLGLEGLQALVIPIVLVLLAVLIVFMPVHRIFYGVIALVVAVYSLVGVNLGGFIVGMLLAAVGGILVVSWMPRGPSDPEEPGPRMEDRPEPGDAAGSDGEVVPEAGGDRRESRRTRRARNGALAAAAALGVGLASPVAAPASAAEPPDVRTGCVLLVICSPDPTATPTPTTSPSRDATPTRPPSPGPAPSPTATQPPKPGESGEAPGGTIVEAPGQDRSSAPKPGKEPVTEPEDPSDLTTGTPLVALGEDNDHGVFTLPSANTQGGSLEISGLKRAGIVTVPLADGTRATTIRIECDELTIDGFQLDTLNRREVADLDTGGMTLRGDVVVWIDRVGTVFDEAGGLEKSLQSDPLALEPLMTLLGQGHLVLGLVGAQADHLSYSSFEQKVWVQ